MMSLKDLSCLCSLIVAGVLGLPAPVRAHPPVATTAVCVVQPPSGDAGARLTITIHHDALAFILNDTSKSISDASMNALLDEPRDAELERLIVDARDRLASLTQVWTGDRVVPVAVEWFPGVAEIRAWARDRSPRLPVRMDAMLSADMPLDASSFSIAFPEILGPVVFTYESGQVEAESRLITPGQPSPSFRLPLVIADRVPEGPDGRPLITPADVSAGDRTGQVTLGLIAFGALAAVIAVMYGRRSR